MPRKTDLSEQLINRFHTLMAIGVSYRGACRRLGIPFSTFKYWRKRGEESVERLHSEDDATLTENEELYADLWLATSQGLGEIERKCAQLLSLVADGNEQGVAETLGKNPNDFEIPLDVAINVAQWILVRRCNWSKTQQLELGTIHDQGEREVFQELMENEESREKIGDVMDDIIGEIESEDEDGSDE